MKEHPILFKPEMVRAILDGRKTISRRTSGLKYVNYCPDAFKKAVATHELGKWAFYPFSPDRAVVTIKCPYGVPGDRLLVREAYRVHACFDGLSPRLVLVAMGGDVAGCIDYKANPRSEVFWGKWRNSIHMCREFSRIMLEVTGMRVQRLQDISKADAMAEGVERVGGLASCNPWRNYLIGTEGEMNMHCSAPSRSFQTLCNSINGSDAWDKNSWVWVPEFRVVA